MNKLFFYNEENKLKISIVGCGTIGSIIAFYISMRSEFDKNIKELNLIDMDSYRDDNRPFFADKLTNPKVISLSNGLNNLFKNSCKINSHFLKYPEEINFIKENYYMIDCRDTSNESSDFDIKILIDGKFLNIIKNPIDKIKENNFGRYHFEQNKYYPFIAGSIIMKYIFTEKTNENTRTIINLETYQELDLNQYLN